MTEQQTEILNSKIREVKWERTVEELALGWLRYEALRKVTPWSYAELNKQNLVTRRAFDDLVDEMITKPD